MDATRWELVQSVFNAALDVPPADRDAFVELQCADDTDLAELVRSMLREDDGGVSVLDTGMAQIADLVLSQSDDGVPPDTRFGAYRIVRLLGSGGMGVVYLAERDDIGSRAAVKILRDAWLSPARRLRFASEQRTLASLTHASIARLYDAGALANGTPWFVMEYVEGLPVTEYCSVNRCSIRERLRIFRDVCDAVMHAHAHAVIHRDLKPSNILVSHDAEVKLLDFGIAKQLDMRDATDVTRTALRLMTPAYAAPEQLRGGVVGVQSDVYSLGVVLYELLAGQPPFDLSRSTPGEAEATILEREPERPSFAARRAATADDARSPAAEPNGAEWADLDVLCLTAMHKDMERRYRSVEALARDVDNYLAGTPLDARPDSVRYTTRKFLRRNWRPVSMVAAAVAIMIGTAAFYTVRVANARNTAIAEAARTQRVQAFMLNLFQGGDADAGPADSLRVVTLVDRGAREARSLTKDPLVQAELYGTLGGIYRSLAQLDRADTLLNAALTQRRALAGADSAAIAESMIELGMLRSDQARFDEAERLVRGGLAIDRRLLPPNHPAIAKATMSLGEILENRGSYAEAITVLGQAVRLERARGDTTGELDATMSELANTHFYLGHYATSDSINRRVLAMSRTLYGDAHPQVANDLINLGAIQFEWEHYSDAERYYRQALAINEQWYGGDNAEVASDLTMLARVLVAESREDEAAGMLRRALLTQERVYGRVHPRVASALNEIGGVALQRKRYDEAANAYSRMVGIYRTVYGDRHYLIGTATANLASVYMARHDYAKAEPLFREAVRRYSDTQGPDHVNTGIALAKLGRCLLRERRYTEAAEQSLAAYNVLRKQTAPPESFLSAVRSDLVDDYMALSQPERAASYRAELARPAKTSGG